MIEALFGTDYAFYISLSFAASFMGLGSMVVWVWTNHRARTRELAALERAGIKRASETR